MTTSAAAAGEISLDTVVATALLELDGIFALQEEQRMALKVYYDPPPPPTHQLYASLALQKALWHTLAS